jgi:hypothetical protein
MTPQSSFMIIAPLPRHRIRAMRELLATMNFEPGVVNPDNPLIPFRQFDTLHFARLLVLEDQTTGDIEILYGVRRPDPPTYFVFLGDFDGDYRVFLQLLVKHAEPGLRQIFSFCEDFSSDADLESWMADHERRPATYYCNWIGRTVQQAREEAQLRRTLVSYLEESPGLADRSPREIHQVLRGFVEKERAAGRLTLTRPAHTPLSWTARHSWDWASLVLLIVGGVVTLPLTLIPLLLVAWRLRFWENSDAEMAPPPDPKLVAVLAGLEDHGVTNQFSAMGTLKPGWLRSFLLALVLWIVDLTTRTLYGKGRLARVHTIHFARWVYLDNRTRLLFASNYDGSLESYMDDFINKVGFGLNVVFSNGVGYPHTDWLLSKGAKNEQLFKYYLRRHELPTDVWYNGHAGLTALDLHRNSRIREGLEQPLLSERRAREWAALL